MIRLVVLFENAAVRRTRTLAVHGVLIGPALSNSELRAVLSVCGVECDLTGGVLNVAGTEGDDSIALRTTTWLLGW